MKESAERETDGESSQAKKQMRQDRGTWEKMRDEYEQDRWKDRQTQVSRHRKRPEETDGMGWGGRKRK